MYNSMNRTLTAFFQMPLLTSLAPNLAFALAKASSLASSVSPFSFFSFASCFASLISSGTCHENSVNVTQTLRIEAVKMVMHVRGGHLHSRGIYNYLLASPREAFRALRQDLQRLRLRSVLGESLLRPLHQLDSFLTSVLQAVQDLRGNRLVFDSLLCVRAQGAV